MLLLCSLCYDTEFAINYGTNRPAEQNLNLLKHNKHNINKYNTFYDTYPPTLKVVDDEDLVRVVSVIRDFVCLRQSENTDNVNDIIEFLCVKCVCPSNYPRMYFCHSVLLCIIDVNKEI